MKISLNYIAVYTLILSLFQSSFIIQYSTLILLLIFFLLFNRSVFNNDVVFKTSILILTVAFCSFFYNYFSGNADGYTIIFWLFSYLPPFILIWIISSSGINIDFEKTYAFYKKLTYIQTFFLLYYVFKFHKYIVGDAAVGTIGDANWVAFHICIVLIYEIIRFVNDNRSMSYTEKSKRLLEIGYLLFVFLIPESSANVGLLMIVLGVFFMNKYILYFLKPMRLGVILSVLSVIFLLFSQTMIYRRITESFKFLFTTENLQSNPYLFKFYTYKKLVSGDLYEDTNFLLGSGPSTFTSRSSVIRMPEERVNSFPIELPYFKSEMFNKHISPAYANWRKTKESYGNFASPQTTVISVAAELGLLGVSGFAILFYSIIKTNKKIKYSLENRHLQVFVKYLTLYFILCLFHLNFWEYPIVCFTYIIMVFTIFNSNKTIPTV